MMARAILDRPCGNGGAILWPLDRPDARPQGEPGGTAVIRPVGVRAHQYPIRRLMACGWGDGARAALDPAGPKGERTATGRGEARHA